MFLFRVLCSSAALLALLAAAPFLRGGEARPAQPVMSPVAMDAPAPSSILQPAPDCETVWRPPFPFPSKP